MSLARCCVLFANLGEGENKTVDTNDTDLKAPVLSNGDTKADVSGRELDGKSGEPEGNVDRQAGEMSGDRLKRLNLPLH